MRGNHEDNIHVTKTPLIKKGLRRGPPTLIPVVKDLSYKNTPDKEGIETTNQHRSNPSLSGRYKNTPDKEGIETELYYILNLI